MKDEDLIEIALKHLYDLYVDHGANRINIGEFLASHTDNPDRVFNAMKGRRLLFSTQAGNKMAAISFQGVMNANPNYLSDRAKEVINYAKSNGNQCSVSAALDSLGLPNEFMHANHIGEYIKIMNIATVQDSKTDRLIYLY